MIGAVNDTGWVKAFAPSPEPAVRSTMMNAAAPILSPQKMTLEAHDQARATGCDEQVETVEDGGAVGPGEADGRQADDSGWCRHEGSRRGL